MRETHVHCKTTTRLLLVTLSLVCLALLPGMPAVIPPPDGGYPNFTTAEGTNALKNLTTGAANTALGWYSLFSDTDGSFNTATGAGSLLFNTGNSNTAIGAASLLFNVTATDNTAVGTAALLNNTASGNTAIGANALLNNTTGGTLVTVQGTDVGPNVAVGWEALESNTLAGANTAVGYQALASFVSGPMGFEQIGTCTAVGFQALANANGAGVSNSGFGHRALFSDTTGQINTATGFYALLRNVTGDGNTANGFIALQHNTTGGYNTALGANALGDITTGNFNVGVGYQAGSGNATGNNNIYIGVGVGAGDESDTMRIGGSQTATYIRGISGATIPVGTQVLVEGDGHLGVATSSQRFKEEVKPIAKTSEALFSLKPVTFRYKKEIDPTGTSQFGLVAEEVEKVNPDLIVRDKEGKPYSVRYDQVNAMLLNEFLKEHRKVEQLQATVLRQAKSFQSRFTAQQQQIQALTSGLQKVGAQIEANKPGPRVVLNNP
jgi:trimeric autotransporter adhesin